MKNITNKLLVSVATVVALCVLWMVPAAFSQDDMEQVPVDAFGMLERPRVAFAHDAHNEKAGIDDCVVCHHGRTDAGRIDMENSSEGESCSTCHPVTPEGKETSLMRAYHRQCISCHEASLKGPVACGQCHRK